MDNLGQIVWDRRNSEPVMFLGFGLGLDEFDPSGVWILDSEGKREIVRHTAEHGRADSLFARIIECDGQAMFVGDFCLQQGLCGRGNFGVLDTDQEDVVQEMVKAISNAHDRGITQESDGTYRLYFSESE